MTDQSRPHPLRSELADDPDMMELVELYVADMPERVAALEAHWSASEKENVRRLAHQLKGASSGYGFPSIGEVAKQLETALKDDETELAQVATEFDALITECNRVSL